MCISGHISCFQAWSISRLTAVIHQVLRTGGSLVEHRHAGGREFDSGRTNTQGLKNNRVESAAFVIKSANG